MIELFRKGLARAADFCWPRVCPVEDCTRPSDRMNRFLCSQCFAMLPWYETGGVCNVCGAPMAVDADFDFVCENCRTAKPHYEFARSAVVYEEPLKALIGDFKYRNHTWLKDDLVDILEGGVRAKLDCAAIDVVLPVPLHRNRLRERGFNQSALLAEELAIRINRRFDGTSLVRIRDTEHQARITGAERLKNVAGAFEVDCSAMIRGRTVLLVDDVMTTGATLEDCSRALLKAGAERVWCATVARSVME